MLSPAGIYLLDFESLGFIWVGKDVPKNVVPDAFKMASDAMVAINCKGKSRLLGMSLNLVFYGYEPEVFKSAFRQGWKRLDQPGLVEKKSDTVVEEEENEDSEGEDTKAKGKAKAAA